MIYIFHYPFLTSSAPHIMENCISLARHINQQLTSFWITLQHELFFWYTKRHITDAYHSRMYFYPGLGSLYTAKSSRGNYKKGKRKNLKPEDSENVSISKNIWKICKIVSYCIGYKSRPHRDLFLNLCEY